MSGEVEEDERVFRDPLGEPEGEGFFEVGLGRQLVLEQQGMSFRYIEGIGKQGNGFLACRTRVHPASPARGFGTGPVPR